MRTAYLTLVIVCILSVSKPLALEGQSTKTEASLDLKSYLSVGTIHDSNVSIKEIDSQLKESDTARLFSIGLSARTKLRKLEIGASYSFNRSKYKSFSKFNRESNVLGLEVSGAFFGVRQGFSFHKADAKLGNENFLKLERWSPNMSRFVTKRVYLRGSFIDQTKTIIPRPGQSSKSESITLDMYYFRNGLRQYFLSLIHI